MGERESLHLEISFRLPLHKWHLIKTKGSPGLPFPWNSLFPFRALWTHPFFSELRGFAISTYQIHQSQPSPHNSIILQPHCLPQNLCSCHIRVFLATCSQLHWYHPFSVSLLEWTGWDTVQKTWAESNVGFQIGKGLKCWRKKRHVARGKRLSVAALDGRGCSHPAALESKLDENASRGQRKASQQGRDFRARIAGMSRKLMQMEKKKNQKWGMELRSC